MQLNTLKIFQELREQAVTAGLRREENAICVLISLHLNSKENALCDIGRLLVLLGEEEIGRVLGDKYSAIMEERVAKNEGK